jgi:hypothetical protein
MCTNAANKEDTLSGGMPPATRGRGNALVKLLHIKCEYRA